MLICRTCVPGWNLLSLPLIVEEPWTTQKKLLLTGPWPFAGKLRKLETSSEPMSIPSREQETEGFWSRVSSGLKDPLASRDP